MLEVMTPKERYKSRQEDSMELSRRIAVRLGIAALPLGP